MGTSTPQSELMQAIAQSAGEAVDHVQALTAIKNAETHWGTSGGLQSLKNAATQVKNAESGRLKVLGSVQGALALLDQPPPTPVPSPSPGNGPNGPAGNWTLKFEDLFSGTALSSNWTDHNGWKGQNGVTDNAANVLVNNGLQLILSNQQTGAAIETANALFNVGDYAEASVYFPGNGQTIYNWPAWWVSGPNWPAAGESDIAEGLGTLTVNYHSPSGAHNQGTIPGVWADGFHTYGIYRGQTSAQVFWDGKQVKSYATDDNGAPQNLIFTLGLAPGTPASEVVTGPASAVKVQYVRVWS